MLDYNRFEYYMTRVANIQRFSEDIDEICGEFCDKKGNYSEEAQFFFPTLQDDVVGLLADMMDDKEDTISFWIYELNCGDGYRYGCYTDKHGNNIELKTIRNVYDYLIASAEDRKNEEKKKNKQANDSDNKEESAKDTALKIKIKNDNVNVDINWLIQQLVDAGVHVLCDGVEIEGVGEDDVLEDIKDIDDDSSEDNKFITININ